MNLTRFLVIGLSVCIAVTANAATFQSNGKQHKVVAVDGEYFVGLSTITTNQSGSVKYALEAVSGVLSVRTIDQRYAVVKTDAKGALIIGASAPGPKHYMGRAIARTMHYTGAEWLLRESREREEATGEVAANLGVKPGMAVADLGCGNGFYTLKLAELVGEEGRVFAVDIQIEMLDLLKTRAKKAGIENIKPIVNTATNAKLPKGALDLVLLVDVYHEFSHPEEMLKSVRDSLKPEGRVALLEYRAEDPDVPIKPLHKMSKKQIMKEFTANGFRLASQYDNLPWQHMMFFVKDGEREGSAKR